MRVGVPKEVKNREYRVGLTPSSVRELVHHGHEALVETGAGAGSGFPDESYVKAGAEIASSAGEVFEKAGKGALQHLTFLDMNLEVIHREIERLESTRMSGPTAENILRDLGTVADRIG